MESLLLDELSRRCDTYISGLKYPDVRPLALRELLYMNLKRYSLKDCSYSVSYLFGQEMEFVSYGEFRNYIQNVIE